MVGTSAHVDLVGLMDSTLRCASLPISLRANPFLYAAFCFAQRLRCASAILFLPAADKVLFLGTVCNPNVRGRPLPTVEAVPARRERADCKRAISASMAERMSCVFILVRYQRSGSSTSYVFVLPPVASFNTRVQRICLSKRIGDILIE